MLLVGTDPKVKARILNMQDDRSVSSILTYQPRKWMIQQRRFYKPATFFVSFSDGNDIYIGRRKTCGKQNKTSRGIMRLH